MLKVVIGLLLLSLAGLDWYLAKDEETRLHDYNCTHAAMSKQLRTDCPNFTWRPIL